MSDDAYKVPLWVIGALVGAFAALVSLGPQSIAPALTVGVALLAGVAWRWWRRHRAANSVLNALYRHWASLPGAAQGNQGVVLYHGAQPLRIVLSHTKGAPMKARISTPIGALPVAFRIWPIAEPPPELTPDGRRGSLPPLERHAIIESWLAGRFHAESNDDERVRSLVDQHVIAAILTLSDTLGPDFQGLVYDGQSLTIALSGTLVADPERALQIARVLWRPFIP